VRRFAGSLSRRAPSSADVVWASEHLSAEECALWASMPVTDRRHSLAVARRFVVARPAASTAEIAGALLHDVGKVESRLGTFGRVVATLVGPRTDRFRTYHRHEEIGARMLADAGSDPMTVDLVCGRGPAAATLRAADDL